MILPNEQIIRGDAMSKFIPFTEEQKQRANHVDLADFLMKQGIELERSGQDMRLKCNRSVTIRGNQWYDHSQERGGYAVDFVRNFYNMSYPDAVITLLGGDQGQFYQPTQQKPVERRPFILPNNNCDMRRTFAYLIKGRKLDQKMVSHFAREKILYESCEPSPNGGKNIHNCVFVGVDQQGNPRHAHKHGLNSFGESFKRNVTGSETAYSFHHVGKSELLYVFEAPIDMLSFISLYPEQWQDHNYLSLCGVGGSALEWVTAQYSHIKEVGFCLDNDKAGLEASQRLTSLMTKKGYACDTLLPRNKDWNVDLQELWLESHGEAENCERLKQENSQQSLMRNYQGEQGFSENLESEEPLSHGMTFG